MAEPTVPGYDILEPVGVGAASIIYRAKEQRTGKIVAIKHVVVSEKENYKYLRHVRNEFTVLRKLAEANGGEAPPRGIVAAHRLLEKGWLRRQKVCDLVMDYVDGRDLRRERRYPVGQLVHFFTEVARSLQYMHAQGFVHGDLKPENMMVGRDGSVTLVDFGFSCPIGSRATTVRGTRDYMAPEQVTMGIITERTDLYNLGATMYFLLSGRHVPALIPPTENGSQHFIGMPEVEPTPLDELNPDLPSTLVRLVMRCCQKEIAKRPGTAAEVATALESIQSEFGGEETL